jgi:hypothetical protein
MNPLTIAPIYYGYYYIGSLLLGKPALISQESLISLVQPLMNSGRLWEPLEGFAALGWDFMIRWLLAALIVSAVSAGVGYVAAYSIQTSRCVKKARALGLTYEKLLKEMEKSRNEKDRGV